MKMQFTKQTEENWPRRVALAESETISRLQELTIIPKNQEERTLLHAALRVLLGLQMRRLGHSRTWTTARVSR
jgi:hypothetical protein